MHLASRRQATYGLELTAQTENKRAAFVLLPDLGAQQDAVANVAVVALPNTTCVIIQNGRTAKSQVRSA